MTKINMQLFCSESVENIKHPYVIDEYLYATDRIIAIRTRAFDEVLKSPNILPEPPQKIKKIFEDTLETNGRWLEVNLDKYFIINHHEEACSDCFPRNGMSADGDDCETCGGTAVVVVYPKYQLSNGICLDGRYIEKIKTLPGPVSVKFGNKGEPVYFGGPRWGVILMPMLPWSEYNQVDFPKIVEEAE